MKIKDIYFGEIDADTERSSVPEHDFITKNFYDLNSICKTLNAKNGVQVIIGNKGTGKTYLGEYLEASNDKMIYQSIGTITPTDIQKVTAVQSDERGKFVEAWSYTLYTILACMIVNKKLSGWEEFQALLHEIYGHDIDLILQFFESGKKQLFNKKIKSGIRLSDNYHLFTNENGIAPISKIVFLYVYLFNKHYHSQPLYFLLDGLDEHIRGDLTEKQKNYLLDLIDMVEQSHKALTSVRIVLLFRNDILQSLSGEANLNKIKTARSCALSWISNNANYSETPLYQLIEKRIATSEEAIGICNKTKLSDILPPRMQSRDTWEWILELTTHTPRDIISFFNCCKEFAGEQFCFTSQNLWDATRSYSEYLWGEFQDILSGTCLAGMESELSMLFNKIGQSHSVRTNTRFSFSEFLIEYQKVQKLKDIPIMDAHKILYEAGVMCVHTSNGTYWNYREDPLPFDPDIWQCSTFDIHKGLWKKLHIW